MLQKEVKRKFIHEIEYESNMLASQQGEFAIAKAIVILADAIEQSTTKAEKEG